MLYTRLALVLLLLFHSSVQLTASTTEDSQGHASTLQSESGNMVSTLEAEEATAAPATTNKPKTSECPCEFCVSKSAAMTVMLLILSTCFLHVILIVRCFVSLWKICSSNVDAEHENYRLSGFGLGGSSYSQRDTANAVILRSRFSSPSQGCQNSVFPDTRVSTSSRVSFRQSFLNLDNAVNKGKFAKTTEADSPSGESSAENSQELTNELTARTVPIIKVESPTGSNVEFFADCEPGFASPEDSQIYVRSVTPEAMDKSDKCQSCKESQESLTEEEDEATNGDCQPSPSDAPFFVASSPSPLAMQEPFSVASDSCIASEEQALTNYTSQDPAYSQSAGLSTFPGFMNSTRTSSNGNQRPNTSTSLATRETNLVYTRIAPQPDLTGQYSTHSRQGRTHLQQEVQRSEFLRSSEVGAGVTLRRTAVPDTASAPSIRRCTSSGELVQVPAPRHPAAPARRSYHNLSYFRGPETIV